MVCFQLRYRGFLILYSTQVQGTENGPVIAKSAVYPANQIRLRLSVGKVVQFLLYEKKKISHHHHQLRSFALLSHFFYDICNSDMTLLPNFYRVTIP